MVIGAGIGGLAASKALAAGFARVTVLERDILPDSPAARMGAPQGRHVHSLLASGQRALEELFLGLEPALRASGAVPIRAGLDMQIDRPGFDPFPRRDLGWDSLAMSRPLLERDVRFVALSGLAWVAGAFVVWLAFFRKR